MSDREDLKYSEEVHPTEHGADIKVIEHDGQKKIAGVDGENPVTADNPDPRAVIGHVEGNDSFARQYQWQPPETDNAPDDETVPNKDQDSK